MSWFKKYLSYEVGIDFKTCSYFFIILFFYAVYQLTQGSFYASIAVMAEMMIAAYFMGYIQMYLLGNFDESERFGVREAVRTVICSLVYVFISFLFRWYDRNVTATALFFFWMLFCYVSMFLAYKVKREIDTAMLNRELDAFKRTGKPGEKESDKGKKA